MVQRGPASSKGRSLNSIKLKDFPENQGLADDFFDREFTEDETEETVVMSRNDIPDDEDGTEGLAIRSVSSLFDDDDISAGNTTIISRQQLDEEGNFSSRSVDVSEISLDDEDEPEPEDSEEPAPPVKKKQIKAPSSDQISRNPNPVKQAKEKKPPKMPKVKDFGKKKHSAAYRIIKFCIFLLIWIAVAFACYQGYKFGYKVLNDQPMDPSDLSKVQVTVSGDETDDEMGNILLDHGLIDDIGIFKWRCLLYNSEYYAGTFRLSKSYNTEKILNILAGYVYSDSTMEDETSAETETVAETQEVQEDAEAAPEGDGEEYAEGDEEYVYDEEYVDDED